jgi:hypothetical protein
VYRHVLSKQTLFKENISVMIDDEISHNNNNITVFHLNATSFLKAENNYTFQLAKAAIIRTNIKKIKKDDLLLQLIV